MEKRYLNILTIPHIREFIAYKLRKERSMKQGKKKHLWRSISITLILSLVFTSIPAMAFAAESENGVETEQTQGASKELDDVTKDDVIEEESSEYVTAFDLGGGQKAKVISGYPVRYEDEN